VDKIATSDFMKVNDELGLVMGFAIICTDEDITGADKRYFDLHGDHIPEDAMTKASADFMLNSRAGKVMHSGDDVGDIVFAFPMTQDIAKEFGIQTRRTGLMIGWKPRDRAVLSKFRDGTFTGFSIGGSYGSTEELPDD
jgi:hypothetical protein